MRRKRIVLFSLVALLVLGGIILSGIAAQAQPPYPVGLDAWNLGVRAYEVTQSKDGLYVGFLHVDKSKQGSLRIERLSSGKATLAELGLELSRNGEVLSVIWNPEVGEFTLLDAKGQYAHFSFDGQEWVPDDSDDWQILNENQEDVKLVASIASDFSEKGGEESEVLEKDKCVVLSGGSRSPNYRSLNGCSWTCDYSYWYRGSCFRLTRSEACWCATSSANYQCTNFCCWGCCAWMSDCDCICIPPEADYFCSCGRNGFPCM